MGLFPLPLRVLMVWTGKTLILFFIHGLYFTEVTHLYTYFCPKFVKWTHNGEIFFSTRFLRHCLQDSRILKQEFDFSAHFVGISCASHKCRSVQSCFAFAVSVAAEEIGRPVGIEFESLPTQHFVTVLAEVYFYPHNPIRRIFSAKYGLFSVANKLLNFILPRAILFAWFSNL